MYVYEYFFVKIVHNKFALLYAVSSKGFGCRNMVDNHNLRLFFRYFLFFRP